MKKFQSYLPGNVTPVYHGNVVTFDVPVDDIRSVVHGLGFSHGLFLKLLDATDERKENGCFKIHYVFGVPKEGIFIVPYICLKNTHDFPSVAVELQAAGYYERKVQSMFGLKAVGLPDGRELILHENWPKGSYPLRKDFAYDKRPETAKGTYDFQRVDGDGIYEIPVGPIHAGIIEPGHFRFSMAGESIMLLEARLGFVHKGSEKLFEKLPIEDQLCLSEKISGDSTVSHSLTFCQAIESLASVKVPKRAEYLRVVFAELERLSNHFGDIGAIMLDSGFNFGGANGPRIREMAMQINKRLTGSRFMRGVNTIGGVTKDITAEQAKELTRDLDAIVKDFTELIAIADNSASMLNRLKSTGKLPYRAAVDHNIVGIGARASGIEIDTRVDYPYAAYAELPKLTIATEESGDVYARFYVRIKEVYISVKMIKNALQKLPEGATSARTGKIAYKPNSTSISVVEGWRGEILYMIITDSRGEIARVMVRDPSFINWQVVGFCGPGNIVPDFPLINKSFNLSYTGHDV